MIKLVIRKYSVFSAETQAVLEKEKKMEIFRLELQQCQVSSVTGPIPPNTRPRNRKQCSIVTTYDPTPIIKERERERIK